MAQEEQKEKLLETEEVKQRIEKLRASVGEMAAYIDVDGRRKRLAELEAEQASGDFWNDQAKAKDVIAKTNAERAYVNPFDALSKTVEDAGMRPWMWSDYAWTSEDFFERCPKSVVQQNWFYDSAAGGFDLATNDTHEHIRLETFYKLDQAGFDQVPCGTNWPGGKRRREGLGADDVIGRLTQFSLANISKEHLMGLMMGTWEIYCWDVAGRDEYLQKILHGIDLFGEAIAAE